MRRRQLMLAAMLAMVRTVLAKERDPMRHPDGTRKAYYYPEGYRGPRLKSADPHELPRRGPPRKASEVKDTYIKVPHVPHPSSFALAELLTGRELTTIDKDGDGGCSEREFIGVVEEVMAAAAEEMWTLVDENTDGLIDMEEFGKVVQEYTTIDKNGNPKFKTTRRQWPFLWLLHVSYTEMDLTRGVRIPRADMPKHLADFMKTVEFLDERHNLFDDIAGSDVGDDDGVIDTLSWSKWQEEVQASQKKKKKKKGECQVQQGAADAATSCTRQQGQVGSSSSHASTHQQRQALPYSLSATSGPVGSTQDWSAVYTVMMRNVPFKWTQYDLLEELSRTGFLGSFDFLYLPIDPDTDSNRGYAFINFASSACAHRFKVSFEDRQLNPLDSRKLVSVVPALRQGYAANHAYYAQAKVSRGDYSRRPLFLREDCGLPTDRQVMHTDEQHGAIYMNVAAPPIISGGTQHPHAAMSINAAAFPTTSEGTEHVHTVSRALSGLRSALGLSLSEPPSRYCTSCGSKGQAHGSFCTSCGNSMRCDLDTDAIECL
eukprot:gnl/TRDRNA2_/TRDRNA2_81269_c0_seq2.p1 gnl/TRDRNA2_/TRDRNA2_81269_c0~~gnl/TRDRNA2_/TRDRNA2_81269_c0_seq2.p1  ORF type:complete len:544 (-),score=85.93 gnl/TRDRNA2_/TRDRNA2_81269_c0_seq2:408-2039(-)